MFSKSAQYYDDIYASIGKDYSAEVDKVNEFIRRYKRSDGKALLDVACGTGIHAGLLNKYFKVEGLDLDAKMLSAARKNYPKIRFTQNNMMNFKLGRQFDVIACLFSSIGYVKTKSNLNKAIKNMADHLFSGGVLLIEPWFTPEQWNPGRIFTLHVNKPDLKIVRMSHSGQRGKVAVLEFQYLFGTPKGIAHETELHELGLFSHEEYLNAFKTAGLKVIHNKKGLDGRGLYIGMKAAG